MSRVYEIKLVVRSNSDSIPDIKLSVVNTLLEKPSVVTAVVDIEVERTEM